MLEDIKKFNVVLGTDNESYIGKAKDITEMFFAEISKKAIDTSILPEDRINDIKLNLEFLEQVQEELMESDTIKVTFNPMGCFNYEIL